MAKIARREQCCLHYNDEQPERYRSQAGFVCISRGESTADSTLQKSDPSNCSAQNVFIGFICDIDKKSNNLVSTIDDQPHIKLDRKRQRSKEYPVHHFFIFIDYSAIRGTKVLRKPMLREDL